MTFRSDSHQREALGLRALGQLGGVAVDDELDQIPDEADAQANREIDTESGEYVEAEAKRRAD